MESTGLTAAGHQAVGTQPQNPAVLRCHQVIGQFHPLPRKDLPEQLTRAQPGHERFTAPVIGAENIHPAFQHQSHGGKFLPGMGQQFPLLCRTFPAADAPQHRLTFLLAKPRKEPVFR